MEGWRFGKGDHEGAIVVVIVVSGGGEAEKLI